MVGFDKWLNENCGMNCQENNLCNEKQHVARVPYALLTQGLTRILWVRRGEPASCVWLCVAKGRTGEGRCVCVGPELVGDARKTTGKNAGESQFEYYCCNCVVTLTPHSILQQPRRCTTTFSSLVVKYCSV